MFSKINKWRVLTPTLIPSKLANIYRSQYEKPQLEWWAIFSAHWVPFVVLNCCQLWLLVQAVASFVSTWRLIPKSTDQLYAIPIDCIAVDLIIQDSAMLQQKKKIQFFPVMLHGGQKWILHSCGGWVLKVLISFLPSNQLNCRRRFDNSGLCYASSE